MNTRYYVDEEWLLSNPRSDTVSNMIIAATFAHIIANTYFFQYKTIFNEYLWGSTKFHTQTVIRDQLLRYLNLTDISFTTGPNKKYHI